MRRHVKVLPIILLIYGMVIDREILVKECVFKTSRSGGKGGQKVNKIESKVEVLFNVDASEIFDTVQKALLNASLVNKIDNAGNVHTVSQTARGQLENKEIAIVRMIKLLEDGLKVQKPRKPTKVPKSVILKRTERKLVVSAKKKTRQRPEIE